MAIDIVDLPINSMVIVHSFLYVYQRVIDVFMGKSNKNRSLPKMMLMFSMGNPGGMSFGMCYFRVFLER